MAEVPSSDVPDPSMVAAMEKAAAALPSLWDAARNRGDVRFSSSQLRAMLVVEEHEGINLRRLAELLGMLLSSASRLCDRMVAADLLRREPGRVDRREISLHLTPAARALLGQLRDERRRRLNAIVAAMSPGGRQALLQGLVEFDAAATAIGVGITRPNRLAPTDGPAAHRDGVKPHQLQANLEMGGYL